MYCGSVIGGGERPSGVKTYIPTSDNRTELLYIIIDNLPQNSKGIELPRTFFRVTIYPRDGKSLHVETHK